MAKINPSAPPKGQMAFDSISKMYVGWLLLVVVAAVGSHRLCHPNIINAQLLGLPVERAEHRHHGPGMYLCMHTQHTQNNKRHPPPKPNQKPTPAHHQHTHPQLRIDPPYTRAEIKTLDASAKADFIDRLGNMVSPPCRVIDR